MCRPLVDETEPVRDPEWDDERPFVAGSANLARVGDVVDGQCHVLRALEWRDVHLEWKGGRVVGGTVQLRAANAKNKRGKVLPLRGELVAILERRAADRRLDCVHVFHRTGRPLVSFRKAWRAACTAAGLAGVLVHDLRRSAARNALRTRKTHERVVMELGGWRTRSVFDRYNITSEEDLANAVEAISDYVDEHGSERPTVEPLHGTGGSGPGDGSRRG